ncbi:MAG: GldG family protein [Verrucomicrobiales bacterium]|nr:GldG family protein [Verrucomicrobiales bacterium]
MSDELPPSFSFSRKWSQRINVLVGILSLLAIVVMLNHLATRHYQRYHVRLNDRAELSPLSRRILTTLTNEIRVTCYYSREDTLYSDVKELLREYRSVTTKLIVDMVDPLRDTPEAKLIKSKYGIPANENSFVIFESQGRIKLISQKELFEYDLSPLMTGQSKEIKRKNFKGELLFTSAIYYLASQRQLKAYFVAGLGGPLPTDQDDKSGFSKFARLLEMGGIEWDTLRVGDGRPVPEDCSLLVVAGPRSQVSPEAIDAIENYLQNGGRALMLFDVLGVQVETGLEAMLRRFGVKVGFDNVRDKESTSLAGGGRDLVIGDFSPHPIMASLSASSDSLVHVMLPRSVFPLPRAAGTTDRVTVEPLFTTGPQGMIYEPATQRSEVVEARPLSALRTNVPIAVAVERGGLPGVDAARGGASRLVVVGDSLFLGNQLIASARNSAFAQSAINWLVDRSLLLADVGTQPYHEFRLSMKESEQRLLMVMFLVGMPGAVLAFGFFVWLRRRS